MFDIAFKMLFGERAKYAMLVSGICFATILMTQGLAMFFGILSFSYATATNIRAPIWVIDPMVQQVGDNQPLRDTDVERVMAWRGRRGSTSAAPRPGSLAAAPPSRSRSWDSTPPRWPARPPR
jgi:putative ABC transport system permease protein